MSHCTERQHHLTIPRHAALRIGTLAAVLAELESHHQVDRDALGREYDVARDGRFLINTVLDDVPVPITLLQNWRPEPKK